MILVKKTTNPLVSADVLKNNLRYFLKKIIIGNSAYKIYGINDFFISSLGSLSIYNENHWVINKKIEKVDIDVIKEELNNVDNKIFESKLTFLLESISTSNGFKVNGHYSWYSYADALMDIFFDYIYTNLEYLEVDIDTFYSSSCYIDCISVYKDFILKEPIDQYLKLIEEKIFE